MQMAMAGVDNLKPSAAFNDRKDADAVDDLANDDDDYGSDDDDDSDGDYFTMQMAGDEYPPLSSLKEKSERLAVDQEGRDFYDDNDDGDDVAGDDGVDDGEEEGDLTEGQ